MILIDQKVQNKPILLILKTPPPYGGGELLSAALCAYVSGDSDFIVQEIRSPKRDKTNQGVFAFWKIAEFIVNWWHFLCLMRRHRPRLVFCPLPKEFLGFFRDSIFFWTARLHKVNFAGELGGESFSFLGNGTIQTWYGKLVLSRLICLRTLGKTIAQRLEKLDIKNTIVTDNGVKCQVDPKYCAEPKDGVVRLVFVGTHSPQKGFDQMVEACVVLTKKGLSFEVHALGEWISIQFQERIYNFLRENDLTNRFVFHGLVHGREKWSVLAESQILVLPSIQEGQPLVILEALACGIPVVASRVGAIPDTIAHGINGFLVSPGVPTELAERLEDLIKNPELLRKISEANLQLYQQRFTQEAFLRTQVAWLKACASGELMPGGQLFAVNPELCKRT